MIVSPPWAAAPSTGSTLEAPTSESPATTDWTVFTPEARPWVCTVSACSRKKPLASATAMSDCENAGFSPGSETLIVAGSVAALVALGAAGDAPPHAATSRPAPSTSRLVRRFLMSRPPLATPRPGAAPLGDRRAQRGHGRRLPGVQADLQQRLRRAAAADRQAQRDTDHDRQQQAPAEHAQALAERLPEQAAADELDAGPRDGG